MAQRIYINKPILDKIRKMGINDCPVCNKDLELHSWIQTKNVNGHPEIFYCSTMDAKGRKSR